MLKDAIVDHRLPQSILPARLILCTLSFEFFNSVVLQVTALQAQLTTLQVRCLRKRLLQRLTCSKNKGTVCKDGGEDKEVGDWLGCSDIEAASNNLNIYSDSDLGSSDCVGSNLARQRSRLTFRGTFSAQKLSQEMFS
jgi:hypothetical protein